MNSHGGIDDLIAQFRQRVEMLTEDNRALRAQLAAAQQELAELKRGAGITVLVNGQPVATGANVSMAPTADVLSLNNPPQHQNGPRPYGAPGVGGDRRAADVLGGQQGMVQGNPFGRQGVGLQPDANGADAQGRPGGRNVNFAGNFLD